MKQQLIRLLKAILMCVFFCLLIGGFVSISLHLGLLTLQKTFLYRLLILTGVCCVVFIAVSAVVFWKRESILGIDFSFSVLCVGLASLFMALFFALGPMTIERSYTIYSLAYLNDYNDVYSYEEIRDQFVTGYVDAGATQKRIDEQVAIGNLEQIDGGYRITPKGERLVALFRIVETVFPVPDESSIYPDEVRGSEIS